MTSVNHLLEALDLLPTARASDLGKQLEVSQPTVSRLITAAGSRVCRMGAGRQTRYARTRTLLHLGTQVPVYRIDEAGRIHPYGLLHFLTQRRHWLARQEGPSELFDGFPPFAEDMAPQGYIGRSFAARYPELGLPPRPQDWTEDQALLALALRGEDCVGDLIIGDESLNRFLAETPPPASRSDYPQMAQAALSRPPGSSAGGEQPKFATSVEDRHVVVKFAGGDDGAAARRWRDLLVCESLALDAVRAAGLAAATSQWLDVEAYRFMEVNRFDRVGLRGRRPLLSLRAIDNEYLGLGGTWTRVAQGLLSGQHIRPEDAWRVRWLDTFGQLIGNTDRHLGNLSFFVEGPMKFRLAPVYDMLPMVFAPQGTSLSEHRFVPAPPSADTLDVWGHAARCAREYWSTLASSSELSDPFRERCLHAGEAVDRLIRQSPV
ncbi:type II toxin-antitoxin system HipA family toxin YjjJ [Stigmatella sp. ncwal1]|uniref:Type II toxin-antitoxin system HipA family toxin YjjJ n=1 Tax=Stigmatella ashevillensis TaxID=2995309 RepID=A0ABT5DJ17_9BACT|nr:type II toxin-antitoxin system HipA family toxin YjjJ [Stigmatella ashevillena]MDC0712337.1 type II toxin-antitoxin system HipA family toxin YjjJ [Stigmatella ashevillena]